MITIAICDDEKIIAEQIKRLASVFFAQKYGNIYHLFFLRGGIIAVRQKHRHSVPRHPDGGNGRHGDGEETAQPEF